MRGVESKVEVATGTERMGEGTQTEWNPLAITQVPVHFLMMIILRPCLGQRCR